jgi:hypothetical protein
MHGDIYLIIYFSENDHEGAVLILKINSNH